ncbi:MAG: LCP family protein [Anaerolineae bacterium]|jgi:LCP family protein required for cell wall assembly|nr:LCP family protein [Anaerolineae bacterium]MBT7073464.1 LCP family protein [Anaerolineae bacterium]MBT7782888.1 LCP family protein [Anaerolineae bacterium]
MSEKMSTLQKILLFFLGIGILILCLMVADSAYKLWQNPLGPVLELPKNSYTPRSPFPATWTPEPNQIFSSAGTPYPEAAPTGLPICGGPRNMTILAIGSDQRGDIYNYGLGDVIRLVRVDFVTPRVTIMSFPRDLYVEIPGISDHYGITHGKLNQSYLYGNTGFGYYDGEDLGPGLMARTLAHNFGAQPDNYIAINMQTFVRIVDAIGGILVDLPETIDGRAADQASRVDLVFYSGKHYLEGSQALQLARLRPYGTFKRASAQNQVLCALYDKLLSPRVIDDIPEIISSFQNRVQTDLSPAQISQLACLGTELKGSDIIFLNWPEEIFTGTRVDDPILGYTYILETDFSLIQNYVDAFSRGSWLAEEQSTSTETKEFSPKSFCE